MYGAASADYITELGFIVINTECVEAEALKRSENDKNKTGNSSGDDEEDELDV